MFAELLRLIEAARTEVDRLNDTRRIPDAHAMALHDALRAAGDLVGTPPPDPFAEWLGH